MWPGILAPSGLGGTDGPPPMLVALPLQGRRDSRRGAIRPAGHPSLSHSDFRAELSGASKWLTLHPRPLSLRVAVPVLQYQEAEARQQWFPSWFYDPLSSHCTLPWAQDYTDHGRVRVRLLNLPVTPASLGPLWGSLLVPKHELWLSSETPLWIISRKSSPGSAFAMRQAHTQTWTRSVQGF